MQLKKLEVCGFKSFADRTEFHFDPGITALVGPNGCGKTNVVDAVKWVLGSQSVKSLRSDEMMDVIFNGGAGRGPLGMAEVSLFFDNSDHRLPIDYDEVVITRRLYRTGQSEYLLNKQSCRLKDIKELFMDTGIGMQSYSIIEQGKIDVLLQANPRERRAIFEEAAGISKYRARRRESESKLERVGQDLLRVGDIVREVNREVRSIKLQAAKAEKYQVLLKELSDKKLRLGLHQYRELSRVYSELQEACLRGVALQAETEGKATAARERMTEAGRLAREAEEALEASAHRRAALEAQAAGIDEAMVSGRIRRDELARERAQRDHEAQEARARLESLTREEERLHSEREACDLTVADLDGIRQQSEATVAQAAQACVEGAQALEAKKVEGVELLQKRARYQNDLVVVEAERKNLESDRLRVTARAEAAGREAGEAAARREALTSDHAGLEAEIARLRAEYATLQDRAREMKTAVDTLSTVMLGLHEQQAKLSSRKEFLQDLERTHQGFGAATQGVLAAWKSGEPACSGVLGTVADLCRVSSKHARQIDVALGERAQAIVTETVAQAREVLAYVASHGSGRVQVFPLEGATRREAARWPGSPTPPPVMPEAAGGLDLLVDGGTGSSPMSAPLSAGLEALVGGPSAPPVAPVSLVPVPTAADYVETDPRYAPMVRLLLGSVRLCDSLETAFSRLTGELPAATWLTEAGELVMAEGTVCGGTEVGTTILSRRAELQDLDGGLRDVLTRMESLEGEKVAHHQALEETSRRGEDLRVSIYERNVAALEAQRSLENIRERCRVLEEERKVVSLELAEIANQMRWHDEKMQSLRQVIADLDMLAEKGQLEISGLIQKVGEYDAERSRAAQTLTGVQVQLAQTRERVEQLRGTALRLAEDRMSSERKVASIGAILADLDQRTEAAVRDLAEREKQRTAVEAGLSELVGERARLAAGAEAAADAETETRAAAEAAEAAVRRAVEMLQARRLEEREAQVRLETLVHRLNEELAVDLAGMAAQAPVEPEFPAEQAAAEVDALKQKLSALGNVNLGAIDELKALEERSAFLSAQQSDLDGAKTQCEELIRKLNRESRVAFEETLVKVRENFGAMFRKLFGGGRADIIIEENVDLLDAGIDIVAKPPGKEPASISLLSGGEKTLTAIALILSIFQLRPSPFCVMDEADAALDESNVDRFVSVIREFSGISQFLLITHNKRTMASANIMYGVTMQTPGVSRKISVRLEEVEPMLEGAPA